MSLPSALLMGGLSTVTGLTVLTMVLAGGLLNIPQYYRTQSKELDFVMSGGAKLGAFAALIGFVGVACPACWTSSMASLARAGVGSPEMFVVSAIGAVALVLSIIRYVAPSERIKKIRSGEDDFF